VGGVGGWGGVNFYLLWTTGLSQSSGGRERRGRLVFKGGEKQTSSALLKLRGCFSIGREVSAGYSDDSFYGEGSTFCSSGASFFNFNWSTAVERVFCGVLGVKGFV
jgi:hypothetical protein